MKRILIVHCFADKDADPDVGDSVRWFKDAFRGDPDRFDVWKVQNEKESPTGPHAGVVISGSFASVYQDVPWISRALDFVRKTASKGTPMLGVCFGHQLVAHALGGKVERNRAGLEFGALPVRLNDAGRNDPLFANLPEVFPCQLSHTDAVTALPPGAESLAHSPPTQHQAYRIGENIRCVQFHPEFNVDVMKFVIRKHRGTLVAEGFDLKKLAASLRETPAAATVPVNFEKYFVQSENP